MHAWKRAAIRTHTNPQDGQKEADSGGQAQITHPTEGLEAAKARQSLAKFHFSNIPNTAEDGPAIPPPVQTLDPVSEFPDHTSGTNADLFRPLDQVQGQEHGELPGQAQQAPSLLKLFAASRMMQTEMPNPYKPTGKHMCQKTTKELYNRQRLDD